MNSNITKAILSLIFIFNLSLPSSASEVDQAYRNCTYDAGVKSGADLDEYERLMKICEAELAKRQKKK